MRRRAESTSLGAQIRSYASERCRRRKRLRRCAAVLHELRHGAGGIGFLVVETGDAARANRPGAVLADLPFSDKARDGDLEADNGGELLLERRFQNCAPPVPNVFSGIIRFRPPRFFPPREKTAEGLKAPRIILAGPFPRCALGRFPRHLFLSFCLLLIPAPQIPGNFVFFLLRKLTVGRGAAGEQDAQGDGLEGGSAGVHGMRVELPRLSVRSTANTRSGLRRCGSLDQFQAGSTR